MSKFKEKQENSEKKKKGDKKVETDEKKPLLSLSQIFLSDSDNSSGKIFLLSS